MACGGGGFNWALAEIKPQAIRFAGGNRAAVASRPFHALPQAHSHDGKITIFERRLRGNPVTPTEKGWIVRCAQVTRQN